MDRRSRVIRISSAGSDASRRATRPRRVYEGVEDVYSGKPDLSARAREALFGRGDAEQRSTHATVDL
jgi:hypothetical protein